jgi:hypothetical protein
MMCAVEPLTSQLLSSQRGLRHGFFTRRGGVSTGIYASLNCGPGSADEGAHVAENRIRVMRHLGFADDPSRPSRRSTAPMSCTWARICPRAGIPGPTPW